MRTVCNEFHALRYFKDETLHKVPVIRYCNCHFFLLSILWILYHTVFISFNFKRNVFFKALYILTLKFALYYVLLFLQGWVWQCRGVSLGTAAFSYSTPRTTSELHLFLSNSLNHHKGTVLISWQFLEYWNKRVANS